MDERKVPAEPEKRRKKSENPLLQTDGSKSQKRADSGIKERTAPRRTAPQNTAREISPEEMRKNVYKLRILTIILVLLIIALIAAFISEIGIYGKQSSRTNESAAADFAFVQTEQMNRTESGQEQTAKAVGTDAEGGLAGL